MKQTITTIATVALTVAAVLFLFEMRAPATNAGQNFGEIIRAKSGEVTKTSVLCNTTSTLLLATSTGRQYAAIVNDGSTNIYLSLDQGPAIKYEGIRLNASGGSYEITLDNLYTGPIYCIADTSAASTTLSYF